MKSDRLGKHLLIVFILTLVVYVGFYQVDKWLRVHKGPWQADFLVSEGVPVLRVVQPALGIATELRFPGETAALPAPASLAFNDVLRTNVPFGTVVFQDLTYLPGTVTLNCFGHEIELLPRTLVINRKETAWPAGQPVALDPATKLPPDTKPAKRSR
jgi:hypothetical protein